MTPRINLVTLGVTDMARSRAFYERLGFNASAASRNIGPSNAKGAQVLADWVGAHADIRKIAALADGLPGTDDGWNQFTAALKTPYDLQPDSRRE